MLSEHQDDWLRANCADALSRLALAQHDYERAYRLAVLADAVLRAIGAPRQPPDQLDRVRVVRESSARLRAGMERELEERARSMIWSDLRAEAGQL